MQIIRGLDARPVVIGHSFGGLIAQRPLGEDLATAGAAIDAAPIKGVIYLPPSADAQRPPDDVANLSKQET